MRENAAQQEGTGGKQHGEENPPGQSALRFGFYTAVAQRADVKERYPWQQAEMHEQQANQRAGLLVQRLQGLDDAGVADVAAQRDQRSGLTEGFEFGFGFDADAKAQVNRIQPGDDEEMQPGRNAGAHQQINENRADGHTLKDFHKRADAVDVVGEAEKEQHGRGGNIKAGGGETGFVFVAFEEGHHVHAGNEEKDRPGKIHDVQQ